MKFKSILILIILLILSLSIGVVSAEDSVDLTTNTNNQINLNVDINTVNIEQTELNAETNELELKTANTESNNNINKTNTKTIYVKTSDVIKAAVSLKSYVNKYKSLPVEVKVGNTELTTAQFTYLMTVAIKNIKNKKLSNKIKVIDVKVSNPYTGSVYKNIKKVTYLNGVNRVYKFIKTYKKVPNYVKSSNKKLGYETYAYGYAKILVFYKSHKRLPNYCLFTSKVFKKAKATKIYSNNLNIYIGNDDYLTATLKNSFGKVLANKKLTLTYNNKNYVVKTNSKGVAKWKLSFNKGGTYTATIKFTGDSTARASKTSAKITVNSAVSFNDVAKTAVDVNKYIGDNRELPKEIIIGNYKLTTADFSYLMANAIINLYNNDTTSNLYIHKVNVNFEGGNLINFAVGEKDFIKLAENVVKAGNSNNLLPATFKVSDANNNNIIRNANFNLYTYSFTRILKYYYNNKNLASSCTFNSYDLNNYISQKDVIIASSNLKKFIETNYYIPAYFKVGTYNLSFGQTIYLITTTIKNINGNNASNIPITKDINLALDEGNEFNINVPLNTYVELANNVSKWVNTNTKLPATIIIEDKNAQIKTYALGFATVLDYYNKNNKLPETSLFSTKIYENYPMHKEVNEINTEDNLTKYVESMNKWCEITPQIQAIANELIKNSTSQLDLAINIFNYVNDVTGYEFYYNSKQTAQETLENGSGNCCDLSHLLVAMYRASGIPVRYCNGYCIFMSGSLIGHVWVQVCVDGIWYACDASNFVNQLGHIDNWFIDSVIFDDYYVLLSF